jgi:hypothetical protein
VIKFFFRGCRKKDNSIGIPCGSIETLKQPSEETKTIDQAPLQQTDSGKEIHVSESKAHSSDFTDADINISSTQQREHNELLRRYYELEEQSQNVLQQLQQTNYWDSQAPYYASTYQQPPVPAYSAAAQDPHSSTAQSSCCYWNCPAVSISCCSASQPSGNFVSMSPYGSCSVSLTCKCPPILVQCFLHLFNFHIPFPTDYMIELIFQVISALVQAPHTQLVQTSCSPQQSYQPMMIKLLRLQ